MHSRFLPYALIAAGLTMPAIASAEPVIGQTAPAFTLMNTAGKRSACRISRARPSSSNGPTPAVRSCAAIMTAATCKPPKPRR